jgi:hypothetical protein
MIYGQWGDYESDYWAVVYYIANYFMLFSILRYMRLVSFTRLQRQFFGLAAIYFLVLGVLNAVCLINIDWYYRFISQVGRFSTGASVLLIGLIFINYYKSHDTKS